MRHESSKKLFSYWLNLKGNRVAPDRSEIEPNDIRNLLADTFILEINHEAKYVIYRLAGTRLCAAYGRELKGLGYLVHWDEEASFDVLSAITEAYTNNTPFVVSHHAQTEQKRFMEYETLMLPLAPINDGTSRILGISSANNIAFWHGVEPIITHRLRKIRPIQIAIQNASPVTTSLTPPPLQFNGGPQTGANLTAGGNKRQRKVGHLTLLNGGKE